MGDKLGEKLGERLSKNELTHWFTIEFHEKAVGHEEAVTSLVETTQKSTQKTTQKQQAILSYLNEHPGASIRDVSLNVKGVTENGVKSILQALRQKDLLKRIGPDKGGRWEVLKGAGNE